MPHLQWIGETVRVTSLDNPETECGGRVTEEGGNRILLLLTQCLPAGASVQVDGPGFLVLGDVCVCEPAGAEYAVFIKVVHVAPNSYLAAAKSA
jgi:hypothetical protein